MRERSETSALAGLCAAVDEAVCIEHRLLYELDGVRDDDDEGAARRLLLREKS